MICRQQMIAKATAEAQDLDVVIPKARKDRREYAEAEAKFFRDLATTSGRKGVRMHRINMAFTDDNYSFIKHAAVRYGRTMTQMVNDIITRFISEHPEVKELSDEWFSIIHGEDEE